MSFDISGLLSKELIIIILLFVVFLIFVYKAFKLALKTVAIAILSAIFPFVLNLLFPGRLEPTLSTSFSFMILGVSLFWLYVLLTAVYSVSKTIAGVILIPVDFVHSIIRTISGVFKSKEKSQIQIKKTEEKQRYEFHKRKGEE